jgi:hypothetical protein
MNSSDISSWSVFWNWLQKSLLSPSNFVNSNFGNLTFLAFCLLAQEMLPLVSYLVGFKQQLPIRTNYACYSSATAISLSTPASASSNSNWNSRVFSSRYSSGRVLLLTSNYQTDSLPTWMPHDLSFFVPTKSLFNLLPQHSNHTTDQLFHTTANPTDTRSQINTWRSVPQIIINKWYVKFCFSAVSGAPFSRRY